MVLINNLTIDEINAALIRLQRMQTEVVGGEKGTTINNVTVNSESSGGGYTTDYSSLLKRITTRLDSAEKGISSNAKDIGKQETKNKEQQQQIEELQALFDGLTSMQITQFSFDEATRTLYLVTSDMTYEVPVPSETVTLSLNTTTNKLTFTMGSQTQEVTLPYINSSEKGTANGVATLDSSGRVPYSQLPESAMEFLGNWDASTNTPHLQDGTGTNGDFYVCNVGGTVAFGTGNTQTFVPNDRVIYNGTSSQWVKLPAGQVISVNGQSGEVVLTGESINYSTASGSPTIKSKIDSVQQSAETQSDWSQTNSSAISFIKNKPTIPAAQIQSDWTQTDSTKKDYIKNKPNLATVATSGSYTDLSNKPTIPAAQVNADWNATTGVAQILNKPTIPAAQIQSDWTQTDSTKKDFIKNKIPIWITSGSADDNMSPINVVEAGNTRPVTSGGVASAIENVPFSSFAKMPQNANLNDYRESGKIYTQYSSAIINTFTNKPSFVGSGEMVMFYIPLGSPNYGIQFYIEKLSTKYAISERVYTNGSWSVWSKTLQDTDPIMPTIDAGKTDANNCYDTGTKVSFYRLPTNSSNVPVSGDLFTIQTYTYNDGTYYRITQIATENGGDSKNQMYIRRGYGTNTIIWDSWERLLKASDLGEGNNDEVLLNITTSVTLYLGANTVYARRKNNIVYLYISGTYTGNPSNSTQLFIEGLPQKYRPKQDIDGLALLGYNATQYATVARSKIGTNGNVSILETSWANGTAIRCGLIYFVD